MNRVIAIQGQSLPEGLRLCHREHAGFYGVINVKNRDLTEDQLF